jgi:hypothetical protein
MEVARVGVALLDRSAFPALAPEGSPLLDVQGRPRTTLRVQLLLSYRQNSPFFEQIKHKDNELAIS